MRGGNCFWWAVDQTVPLVATAVMRWMQMKTSFFLVKTQQQRNCQSVGKLLTFVMCRFSNSSSEKGNNSVFFLPRVPQKKTAREVDSGCAYPASLALHLHVDEDSVAEWKYVNTSSLSRNWWWAAQCGDTVGLYTAVVSCSTARHSWLNIHNISFYFCRDKQTSEN